MLSLSCCPAELQKTGPEHAEPLYDMSHEEAPFSITVKRKGADRASPAVFDSAGHRLVFKVGYPVTCSTKCATVPEYSLIAKESFPAGRAAPCARPTNLPDGRSDDGPLYLEG